MAGPAEESRQQPPSDHQWAPRSPVSGGAAAPPTVAVEGHEADPRETAGPEGGRIDVVVAPASAHVEPAPGPADPVAPGHHLPGDDVDGGQMGVRRAHAIGVADGDVERPGHRPGEGHRAPARSPDHRARLGGVLDAPVAREPGLGWRAEVIDHRGVDGRGVVAPLAFGPESGAGDGGHQGEGEESGQGAPPTGRPARCGGYARGWVSVWTWRSRSRLTWV